MDKYKIFETRTFQQDLARLGEAGLSKIRDKLQTHVYPHLRAAPHFGPNIKRLKNWTPPTWRYRVGARRFFYEIDESSQTVFLTVAEHRSRAYR